MTNTEKETKPISRLPHVLILSGMSGAGKTSAAKVLEDLGYTVIDNLPMTLLGDVVDHHGAVEAPSPLAVGIDIRGGNDIDELRSVITEMLRGGVRVLLLFLDADDATLIRRYDEVRRPHPVETPTVGESIVQERVILSDLREAADVVIDTTDLNVHQLTDRITKEFSEDALDRPMRVSVESFGFKHGVPRDVDLVFDVRFLPNPHWVAELRPLRGTDAEVADYVFSSPDAVEFLDKVDDMLEFLIPRFEQEGKSYVSIAVGCTGGHHRSVAMAEAISERLSKHGVTATVHHRDTER